MVEYPANSMYALPVRTFVTILVSSVVCFGVFSSCVSVDARLQQSLLEAAVSRDAGKVRRLLWLGADPNKKPAGSSVISILHGALFRGGNEEVVGILVRAGARVDPRAMQAIVQYQEMPLLRAVVENAPMTTREELYIYVAEHGTTEMLKVVLSSGVQINAIRLGKSALHAAVERPMLAGDLPDARNAGGIEKVKLLLARGINRELKSDANETAIQWAQRSRSREVCTELCRLLSEPELPGPGRTGSFVVYDLQGARLHREPNSRAEVLTTLPFLSSDDYSARSDKTKSDNGIPGYWLRVDYGRRPAWLFSAHTGLTLCRAGLVKQSSGDRPTAGLWGSEHFFKRSSLSKTGYYKLCPQSSVRRTGTWDLCLARMRSNEGGHPLEMGRLILKQVGGPHVYDSSWHAQLKVAHSLGLKHDDPGLRNAFHVQWGLPDTGGYGEFTVLPGKDSIAVFSISLNGGPARCEGNYPAYDHVELRIAPDGKTLFRLQLRPHCEKKFGGRGPMLFKSSTFDVFRVDTPDWKGHTYFGQAVPAEHRAAWKEARPFGYKLQRSPNF